jgi:MFS transporter, DHA3 family, macrolide efflux protein
MEAETFEKKQKINVFKNRNYSLLFWGVFVSNVAHIIFGFAISLYILTLAAEAFGEKPAAMVQAGYLALSGIVLVLLVPFGGVLADKLNKVRTMYITDYIRGLTIILAGLLLLIDMTTTVKIVLLFVMNLILCINAAFFTPASSSLLRFIVSDEELQSGASLLQGAHNIQAIIGLILGGILYSTLGIVWIFIINGAGYILSAVSEMFIRYDHQQHTNSDPLTMKAVFADIKDGISYLFKEKAILGIMFMALALNFFLSPVFSNAMPYFINFKLSLEESYLFMEFLTPENWFSIISVSLSVSAIIMALFLSQSATKDKYGRALKAALIGFVLPVASICVSMILYYAGIIPINAILIILVSMMFIVGIANVSFNIPVSLIMQRKVDRNMLGKVSSVSSVLSQALIPVSSLIAGVIISQINVSALYLFCLIGMLIITFLYVTSKISNEI